MNKPSLPNSLTYLRLVSAVPCSLLIFNHYWQLAGTLFVLAVITDMADGYFARKQNKVSAFGALLDHSSDAIFVTACLGALALLNMVSWILPVLVLTSFLQYVLDSQVLAGMPLRASYLGRINGIAYFVLAGFPTLQYALNVFIVPDSYFKIFGWLLILSTITSMLDRLAAVIRKSRTSDH